MIIVSCSSYQEAQDAYDIFMNFLDIYDPWSIERYYPEALGVDTNFGLGPYIQNPVDHRYIFCDYMLCNVFSKDTPKEVINWDEFWLLLNEYVEAMELL